LKYYVNVRSLKLSLAKMAEVKYIELTRLLWVAKNKKNIIKKGGCDEKVIFISIGSSDTGARR
ncbi:MAG: hypothetical protein WCL13_02365, partial [bacterium]